MEDNNKRGYFGEGDIGKRSPLAEKPKSHADPTATASGSARSTLAQAEEGAVSSNEYSNAVTNQSEAQVAESQPSFASNVTGNKGKGDKKGKLTGKKSKFRRFGPLGALLAIMLGGGGLMMGAQSLMPFSIVNNLMDNFNSQRTVMNRRSNVFMRKQMNPNRPRFVRAPIFGPERFRVTPRMEGRLARQGIGTVKDARGNTVGLMFRKNGANHMVTMDGRSLGGDIALPDGFSLGDSSELMSLETAMRDPAFSDPALKGSRTWRGHVSGWFDRTFGKLASRLGIERNHYRHQADDSEQQARLNEARKQRGEMGDIDERGVSQEDPDDPDSTPGETRNQDNIRGLTPREKANRIINKAKGVTSSAATFTSYACLFAQATGVIAIAVGAINMVRTLAYATGILESIQKTQAGEGNASPMSEYMNNLIIPGDTGRSAMQSAGMAALFGGPSIDSNNESVGHFNIEGMIGGILPVIGATMATFMVCAAQQVAAGLITLGLQIAGIFTGGLGTLAINFKKAIRATAITGLLAVALTQLTEPIAMMIARNVLEAEFGEDIGNAIMSGAHMYMGKNHQVGGASLGDMQTVVAFHRETQVILAEEAEFERRNRSPLDVTSPHTFLGSIMHSVIPIAATIRSPISAISAASNTVNRSVLAVMPTVSAVSDEARFVSSLNTDCPFLYSVGAVGDAFCNPYFVSDLNTINMDPGHVFERANSFSIYNFENEPDEQGNPQIRLHGNNTLARYVIGCGMRDSPFGLADMGIAARFNRLQDFMDTGTMGGNMALNAVTGNIPLWGSAQAATIAANNMLNADWVSGKNCVASEDNSRWDSEFRYYQRFIEDQRLMEQQGLIEQSAVTAFMNRLEEISPTDTSEAGILARFMGTTREEAEVAMAQIEHLQFLDTYNPVAYGPLIAPAPPEQLSETFENINAEIAEHGQTGPIATITALGAMLRNRAVLV